MSKPSITVRKAENGKTFELLLNDRVIGSSKLQCDAELYANLLNEAISAFGSERYDDGYDKGYNDGYSDGHSEGYDSGYSDGGADN